MPLLLFFVRYQSLLLKWSSEAYNKATRCPFRGGWIRKNVSPFMAGVISQGEIVMTFWEMYISDYNEVIALWNAPENLSLRDQIIFQTLNLI